MELTIVVVDMAAYSTIASVLEQSLGPEATFELNDFICRLIAENLAEVDRVEQPRVLVSTGDGAILSFKSPLGAHQFLKGFFSAAKAYNAERSEPTAMRVFRAGVAYGDVVLQLDGNEVAQFAGITISNAVRLEAAAELGGVVLDSASYELLPEEVRADYTGPVEIEGKRTEHFSAYRRTFDSSAAAMISALVLSKADQVSSDTVDISRVGSFDSSSPIDRLDFLDSLELLCSVPGLIDKIIVGINIPPAHRPPSTLDCASRCPRIFDWAENKGKATLDRLFAAVQTYVIRHGLP